MDIQSGDWLYDPDAAGRILFWYGDPYQWGIWSGAGSDMDRIVRY